MNDRPRKAKPHPAAASSIPASTENVMGARDARSVVQARDVHGGIHFHGRDLSALVPRQLPGALQDFTGRAEKLERLDALLTAGEDGLPRAGAVVITAIDGTAGIGKTTLAVYWAHRVRDHFPGGALYANLHGYGPGQPAEPRDVLVAFLSALGVPSGQIPGTEEEQAGMYRSILDGRKVLVVLDNANAPEQVRPLLPGSTGCLALITSRSRLTGLAISHGANRLSLDLLTSREATAMLAGIVGPQRADAEPDAVASIVQACGRLPLALRIAGQRAAIRPWLRLAEVANELVSERGRLDTLSGSGDELTMVRAAFDWSYKALPPGQARLFCLLGLHPGMQFSVHACAALADAEPWQAGAMLEALADVHLVEPAGPARYQLHDLLRAYALEHAEHQQSAEDLRLATIRLMGFYLHTADNAERMLLIRRRPVLNAAPTPNSRLALGTREKAIDWYRAEQANLIAIVEHAASTELHAVAWQLSAVIGVLLWLYGHSSQSVAMLETGLASARAAGDRYGECSVCLPLSSAYAMLERTADELRIGSQALRLARELGDPDAEFDALSTISDVYLRRGEPERAISLREQAQSLHSASDDYWQALALASLGHAYRHAGRPEDAVRCHRQALAVFQELDDANHTCSAVQLLGDALRDLGHLAEAIICHQQALDISTDFHWPPHQGAALDGLGSDHHASGDHPTAVRYWQQALIVFEQIGRPEANDVRARLERKHPSAQDLPPDEPARNDTNPQAHSHLPACTERRLRPRPPEIDAHPWVPQLIGVLVRDPG